MSITDNSYDNPKNNMNDNKTLNAKNWNDELSNIHDKLASNNNDIDINNFDSNTSYSTSSSRSNSPPSSMYNNTSLLRPNEYSRFKLKIDDTVSKDEMDHDDSNVQRKLEPNKHFKNISKSLTNEPNEKLNSNPGISSRINEKNQFENELARVKEKQKFQEDNSIIKNNKHDNMMMKHEKYLDALNNESVDFNNSKKKNDIENNKNNNSCNKSETSSNQFSNYGKEINSNEKSENLMYNNNNVLNKKDYDVNFNNNVIYKQHKNLNCDGAAEYQHLNIIHESKKETATTKYHQSNNNNSNYACVENNELNLNYKTKSSSSLSNSNETTSSNNNNNKRNLNAENPQQQFSTPTFNSNDANSIQLQLNLNKTHDFSDASKKHTSENSFMNNILNINSNSTTLLENNSKPNSNQDKNTDEQTNGNKRVSKTISNNSNCSSESSGIGSINNNQPSNDESNINADDKELAQIAVENTNKIEKINSILKYKSNNKLNIQNRSSKILHPKKEFKLKLHVFNKNHYINKPQAKNKHKHKKMSNLNNADDDNNDDSMNEAENKLESTNNDYDEEHVAKKIKFSNVNPKKRKLNSSSPIISKQASASFQNELDDDDDVAADFDDEAETDDEIEINDYQDMSGESDEQDDFYNDEIEQFEDLDESCVDNESRNANNEYFSSDGLVDSVKKSKLKKYKYESSYLFRAMSEILTCQLALTRKVDQVRDNFFMIERRLKLIEANLKRSSKSTNRSMLGSSENIINENNKTTGLSSIQPRRMQFDDISNDEEPEDSSSCKKIKDDSNLVKKEKSSTNDFERNSNNIAKSTSSTSPQSVSISPLAKHKQYLASMDNVNKNDTNEMISSHKPKLNESIHSAINNALATAAAAAASSSSSSPPTNFQINDQYLRQQMAQKQLISQHPNEKLIRKSNLAKCNSAPPPLSQTASGLKSAIQAQTPFQASTSSLQQTIPASAASPNFHRRLVASNSAKFAHENKPSITPSLQSHNLLNHNFQTHSNYQRIQQTSQQSQQQQHNHHHHHPHHLSQQQAASQNHSSYFVHGSNNPFSSSHSHSSPGSQMHPSYTSNSNHMNHQSASSSSLQSNLAHPMHLKQSLHSQLAHSNSSSGYHQNLGLLKGSNQTGNTNSSVVLAAAISAAMASSSNLAASGSNPNFSALPLVESLVQQHQANDYQLDNSNNSSGNNNNFNNSSYSAYDDHDYESDDEANYQTDHPSSFIGNSLVQHGPIRHVPSNAVDQLSLSEEAEALVSRDIIKKCIRKAKHRGNFAANLAAELFSKEERITCNCTGTRGKRQLSPRRLNIVKEITYRMYNGNTNTVAILAASGSSAAAAAAAAAHQDFEEAWRKECITAIDAKNRSIGRDLIKTDKPVPSTNNQTASSIGNSSNNNQASNYNENSPSPHSNSNSASNNQNEIID